jgi:hypothetical protein
MMAPSVTWSRAGDPRRAKIADVPFTLAHPAAVLGLPRSLKLSALVAGSVAPDVTYYLPLPGGAAATHTALAPVTTDLVLGITLLVAFRVSVAPLLALAPAGLRSRVPPPAPLRTTTATALVLVASLVVGASTHVVWDAFTQTHGAAVQAWQGLRVPVIEPHKLYNVLGYVSSVGGLAVLAVAILRWYRRTPAAVGCGPGPAAWHRLVVLVAVAGTAAVGAGAGLADPASRVSGYDLVRHVLIGGVRGVAIAVAAYVVCWHAGGLVRRLRCRDGPPGPR